MKEKCFAMSSRGCNALVKQQCGGCAFYKTSTQNDEDQKKAWQRIQSLNKKKQEKIADAYYMGIMPWNKIK